VSGQATRPLPNNDDYLRRHILSDVRRFAEMTHAPKPFIPGEDFIPYAGQVFSGDEIAAATDALLEPWITIGKNTDAFEMAMAKYLGVWGCVFCNSGSSANLLALSALTSQKTDDRLEPGDEVITVAAGFPTTVNPILQCGLVPVLVDVDPATGNVQTDQLEAAYSPRTRAVMLAHALGNPFDVDAVGAFCDEYDFWLIEDNCDALGSLYKGRLTGTFGQLSTQSFYPPHHITTGEGGMVNVSTAHLKRIVESYRDWGRDCFCESKMIDACGKRFDQQHGDLPKGYDHRYTYSHIGYNMKALDLQAAIGVEQMKKLPGFSETRRYNWHRLKMGLGRYEEFFELPHASPDTCPNWFAFMLLVRPGAPFTRRDVMTYLEGHKVGTRMFFGGNLARQPAYKHANMRVVGDLAGSDRMMNDAFFLGVYPGLTDAHIDYMIETIGRFVKGA
jgi:CDP-6-deoxy-D-xylo-4-hexulose-3-dehydrase